MATVRQAVARVDDQIPLTRIRTLDEIAHQATARPRFRAVLVMAFAGLALLLAVVGVFGILAYSVQQRTREFGIRIALGAVSGNVVWLVLREVLMLVGLGVAIGLPAALALTRVLASQLYNIAPGDPLVISLAVSGIAATAAVSAYIPARRATRVDPVTALRYE